MLVPGTKKRMSTLLAKRGAKSRSEMKVWKIDP